MARYTVQTEISHKGLHKYKILKASSEYELKQKATAQLALWDEQWKKKQLIEKGKRERLAVQRNHEENKKEAEYLTEIAEETQNSIDNLLKDNLGNELVSWNDLKNTTPFPLKKPALPKKIALPEKPNKTDTIYTPKLSMIDRLLKNRKQKLIENARKFFEKDIENYEREVKSVNDKNDELKLAYEVELKNWSNDKKLYEEEQKDFNLLIDNTQEKYLEGNPEAITFFIENILEKVEYPFEFASEIEVDYIEDTKMLVMDYSFPTKEDMPTLKKITYVKSREEMKESHFTDNQIEKRYEQTIYQIVLLILNKVYANTTSNIESIVLNGKVHTIDLTTGQEIEPFFLSIKTDRSEFENIKLDSLDPKAWFKATKGISAAKITTITPIAPIIRLDKEDARFIESKDVLHAVTDEYNLAEMDWQDFENLIRELFNQEFNINGGEVKITQASRDGGVDAIAFDPDPIRGGKIVIQAKRYNNVVGVAAVRDLYGTVMNEGANKGILVTTSNYGSDAYNFVKDKPLTLISGANLLNLLEKHGHRAKIELKKKVTNSMI